MEEENKKGKRQVTGFIILVVILIIIAIISRLHNVGKNNVAKDSVTENMTTEEPQIEYNKDRHSIEEVSRSYYSSICSYIEGSNENIDSVISYYPKRFNNTDVKSEVTNGLDEIKDNNIDFDIDNGVFVAADIDKERICFTDSYYIASDFNDIKIVVSSIPLLIKSTSTDAVTTSGYINNVLVANYKGEWLVIPDGHYYFK